MGIGRLMSMVLAGIRVGGIGWELNRRSQGKCMFPLYMRSRKILIRSCDDLQHVLSLFVSFVCQRKGAFEVLL